MPDEAALDAIRLDKVAFDSAIESLALTVKGKAVQCPWHDDQNPSASILEASNGHWRIWCHACNKGGDVFDLREKATGMSVADQFKALDEQPAKPVKKSRVFATLDDMQASLTGLTATYTYWNTARTKIDMVVFRLLKGGKKTFMQAHLGAAGWELTAPPKPWPIYNQDRVKGASHVVIVEGEKDVQTLHAYGIVATTSPGGASNFKNADWSMLAGKTVTIWPDNDEMGAAYADGVSGILANLSDPTRTGRVNPKDLNLKEKEDVTDFVDSFDAQTTGEIKVILQGVIDDAQPQGASVDAMRLLEEKISGKIRNIKFPWDRMSDHTRAIIPGTVTIICGSPGSCKSFMVLEAAAHWHAAGEKVSLFELEEDRTYHLDRAMAQRLGNANLTDFEWIKANPDRARADYAKETGWLDDFGGRIFEAVTDQPTLKGLADWAEAQAKAGVRIIMIDPLSAVESSKSPWADDLAFIMRAKGIAKKYGASIILVMHPRKSGGKPGANSMDDMAGGAAYQRFSQCIIWLERLPEKQQVIVDGREVNATHMAKLLKTRNAKGAGMNIGFIFNEANLRFDEVGVVQKKSKTSTCEDEKPVVSNRQNRMDSPPNKNEDWLL